MQDELVPPETGTSTKARRLVSRHCVCDTPLLPRLGSYQGPEYREDARRPQDQQAAQRLRVVCLHHLDDAQQGLDARSPQMPHIEALEVHQACPATMGEVKGQRARACV